MEIQEFQNWGRFFTIDFDIMVTNTTNGSGGYSNVFRFTANDENVHHGNYTFGGRIPALFIKHNQFFHICSAINGNPNYCQNFDFELEKQYHITIKQFMEGGIIWYEIIIDGESRFKIKNTQPKNFSNVKLYGSDPWYKSFTSDLGIICNVKIQYIEG